MEHTEPIQEAMGPIGDNTSNIFMTSTTDAEDIAAKDSIYTFSDNCDSDEGELKYKIKNLLQSPTKAIYASTEDDDDQMVKKNEPPEFNTSDCAGGGGSSTEHHPNNQNNEKAPPYLTPMDTSSVTDDSNPPLLPPTHPVEQESQNIANEPVVLPVKVKRIPNGNIPKTGKPMAYAIEKRTTKARSKPNRKALVTVYQSQISDNNLGIKLKLRKSDISVTPAPKGKSKKTTKTTRKRSRKSKTNRGSSDSEGGATISHDKRPRKEKVNNNREPVEQTNWGAKIPENVLYDIFQCVVKEEGSLPALVRLGKVCSLWQRISLSPSLWKNLDLSTWTKERYRTELRLKWLIENRLTSCKDLNLSNWKVTNIDCVLHILGETCPDLIGITLTGWKGFSSDNLMFLVEQFKSLRRIDLSSINIEMNTSKSAVGLQSLCTAIQTMNERLTHLYLAHNRLAGIPQIVTALSTYCPNLILLDLSNVSTIAISHGILHIEKLQQGCQKLKVLRITNSHITLGSATLQEQMDSPGFPDLEELSIASLADESRLINDEFLQRILKTSTKLQLLDVRGCARLTHDSLIRLPTWDLKHLFLSGCSVTRDVGSGLELIASKWAHSLIEFDLAWANVQITIDNAIKAIAEKGSESPLNHLNLCGSSVSLEAVKEILTHCPHLNSINLSSCRGLPRGVKRLMQGSTELKELRDNLGVTTKTPKPQEEVVT